MKLRISSLGPVALLASSMMLAFGAQAASADQGIVIYNAQHENLVKSWVDGFTKDTGIKVTLRNGGDSELGNQLVQEGSASPADVFLTENSPAMVLVDLAKPEWKGRWAASPSGADFQAIVSALLALKGEKATLEWLKAMKTNFTAYKGNSTVMKAVNAGQVDSGVIYHYYPFVDGAKTGENSNNIKLYYFKHQDPGAFVSISGGGVLASSKHQQQAQAFIKWITGKQGQEILRTNNAFEYAVGVGAASNPKLVPLKDLDAPKVDAAQLNGKKVVELMTEAGLL
ncbi:extracellular solute-binding protein [Serratia marcescens]